MIRHPPARAMLAATLAAALAGAIALGGCGVKGPLRPAPEAKRKPPATTPGAAPRPGATTPPAAAPATSPETPRS